MKQDGHSDILSLLIAGFDLAFVCAFGWGSEVWQRQSRRKANSTTIWHGIHKMTKKAETAAVGTKSDLFLPLFGISRWASKWRFVSTFALTSDSHEVTIFPCYEFSEVSV